MKPKVIPVLFSVAAVVAATFTSTAFGQLDTVLFNAVTNVVGEGDESPGLSTNFIPSSAVGGNDTPQDAFGNNNGTIEPNTFIFGDGGIADNGNSIFGDGGETVYTLSWDTTSPVTLTGIELAFGGGEGGPAGNRGTQLYEFSIEGSVVASGDANGNDIGIVNFSEASGDNFLLRVTGTVSAGSSGPRVTEINAFVPEPISAALLAMGGLGLAVRRRRA